MKRPELEEAVKQDLEARVRQGIQALFEQFLERWGGKCLRRGSLTL